MHMKLNVKRRRLNTKSSYFLHSYTDGKKSEMSIWSSVSQVLLTLE